MGGQPGYRHHDVRFAGRGILTGAIRELPHWDPKDTRYTFYDYFVEPKFSKVMALLKVLDEWRPATTCRSRRWPSTGARSRITSPRR